MMTEHEQRIAIAEACGWKFGQPGEAIRNPAGEIVNAWYSEEWRLPDYLHDLNAMHSVEQCIPGDKYGVYCFWLHEATNARQQVPHTCMTAPQEFTVIHATAAQRAEAFLRTINKWKD